MRIHPHPVVVTLFLASSRMVTGTFTAREPRLSDALNSRLDSVVSLENAQLGRFGNPSANEPVSVAIVPKPHIAIAYEQSVDRSTTESRRYPYVPKQSAELVVLTAGLRITGTGHGLGEFAAADFQQIVHGGEDHFLPVTYATLSLDVEGTQSASFPFLLLNIRHVQFIARAEQASNRR
jgi:hypothetical protein